MALGASASGSADEEERFFEPVVVPKTAAELARIQKAVRANFLFQHLNAAQSQQIFDAMVKTEAAAGEEVIEQGTRGDHFYIVDSGEYAVTVAAGGARPPVEVMRYTTSGGFNPCFGELAILHSKPRAATVTCVAAGTLWAIDRRSFRAVLMRSSSLQLTRALRSVAILKSLSVNQIQRLEDVLTEVAYADGDYVVREGETTDTFYVIVRGTVAVTKKVDGAEAEVASFSSGYFGEAALIDKSPRAANVKARGPLQCLCIGREGFEEVLGPLQSIIDEDRWRRERLAVERRRGQAAEGLAGLSRGDFGLRACVGSSETSELVRATHLATGVAYTLRGSSKSRAEASGMAMRLVAEGALLAELSALASPFVPRALGQWHDATHLYSLFKLHVVADLQQLLDAEGPLDEAEARFYGASVTLGLGHLHAQERLVLRSLAPDALALDEQGRLLIMDLRFAARLEGGALGDMCGAGLYLAPEQVAQLGHGTPVDFWALGVLLFQMVSGSVPWVDDAEDADSVPETDLYHRIATHRAGGIATAALGLSAALGELINGLLHPDPGQRLGCGAVPEITAHRWFEGVDVAALLRGGVEPPPRPRAWCRRVEAALASGPDAEGLLSAPAPAGDAAWSNAFGSAAES